MSTFDYLMQVKERRGAGYLALFDPDRLPEEEIIQRAAMCAECGADAILLGSSILLSTHFDDVTEGVKQAVDVPVIIFPGDVNQISAKADALLFLSLVSGRNAEYLIGQQAKAAPILKSYRLEAISTGYLLIESGKMTTAEFASNTKPISRDKPEIAMMHALAAEYIGMKMVYLDTGSGAPQPVPDDMVRAVADYISLPIIVGGCIRTPQAARDKVRAGASFIVTGTMLEGQTSPGALREFSEAIHVRG
jgi:putative glycerol-1-phosphate prenyltransferase